jgi:hypothetical protein
MIEGQAVRDAAAAVVPGEPEAGKAERAHELDHVLGRGPLAIGCVLRARGRLAAVAIAAQIGAHHGATLGEHGRDAVPHGMGLGIAVQKQERRSRAADPRPDRGRARRDVAKVEALEHACPPSGCIRVIVPIGSRKSTAPGSASA